MMKWKQDKTMHAVISFLLTIIGWVCTGNMMFAMLSALFIGILKEMYDEFKYGGFDIQDIYADAIGIIAGAMGIYLVLEIGVRLWIIN